MSPSPHVPYYVELLVPSAESEQEFLLLAVQAAVKKYRETRNNPINPPQVIRDKAYLLQENAC